MMIFVAVCLLISISSIELLIVSKFHSYNQRLLPLVLGLFVVYEFYVLVELLTGATAVFLLLKHLLLIQLMDLFVYYLLDLTDMKLSLVRNYILLSVLFATDVIIFMQAYLGHDDRLIMLVFASVTIMIFTFLALKALYTKVFSPRVKKNYLVLFIAFLVPSIALILSLVGVVSDIYVLPPTLSFTCLVLDVLFVTDRLRDVGSFLKEEMFQKQNIPTILFDEDYFFVDASTFARKLMPEIVEVLEKNPDKYAKEPEMVDKIILGNATERWIEGHCYNVVMQRVTYGKKNKGYIVSYIDVTSQKQEIYAAQELAKMKSHFLANMSHDLRSPLHAIIGGSEIVLSRDILSERNRAMVSHIHESGENLLDIVNSILDFSKLENQSLELHPKKYNFLKLIESQAQICFVNINEEQVMFDFYIDTEFPKYLYGDETRVRQIIQNILSNAVKFTIRGAIHASIHFEYEKDRAVKLHYQVTDTGEGIAPDRLESIFDNYVSFADQQTKEGTGLGLSIVKQLAEMMGGEVKAESDGKSGSTFSVTFYQQLPESETDLEYHDAIRIMNADQVGGSGAWNEMAEPSYIYPAAKVLLADDMAVNRDIFKEMTAPWGFSVDLADNGLDALLMAKKKAYDLIVLDQMMPVMTGTEAADEIKGFSAAPLILLTANITDAMREESVRHGFVSFLPKPIDSEQLKSVIETFLPEHLRVVPGMSAHLNRTIEMGQGYMKALASYIEEMKAIYQMLPEYKEHDRAMFSNKVHGIKGVSRQLGKENMALSAEIMEMAAKTDNMTFVHEHFDRFRSDMELTIEAAEIEYKRLLSEKKKADQQTEQTASVKEQLGAEAVMEKISFLKAALEQYETSRVDALFAELDGIDLPEQYVAVLEKAKELYEDMDYLEAAEVLNVQ